VPGFSRCPAAEAAGDWISGLQTAQLITCCFLLAIGISGGMG
jgi:hypothetical protein